MNELETAITDLLQAQAQGAAMNTDTEHEAEILSSRLESVDRHAHRQRLIWGVVAAAAAIVLVVVGTRVVRANGEGQAVSPRHPFASTNFGVPFTVESFPKWLTTESVTNEEDLYEWVIWNRCPDHATECIGLQFNRYSHVQGPTARTRVTYASYLAYLDGLGRSGAVTIGNRTTTTVGGRPAVVYTISAPKDILDGVGCHSLYNAPCDDFYAGVPGRYAVVDTGDLDPDGEVMVIWTRAGAVATAEQGWQQQFDQMLATVRFTKPDPRSS